MSETKTKAQPPREGKSPCRTGDRPERPRGNYGGGFRRDSSKPKKGQ